MADNKKSTVKKPTKKEISKTNIKENKRTEKKSYSCKPAVKLISTIVISSVVTASIVITTPLWMGKLLPAEKQPAFLRKALMPVTNVKVIKTEPLPNDIEKLLDEADANLTDRVETFEQAFIKSYQENTAHLMSELKNVKETLDKELKQRDIISNESIRSKMYTMAFYNMYDKALKGYAYAPEIELMNISSEKELQNDENLSWVNAYKDKPPVSLRTLGEKTNKNYSHIIIENIQQNETGLKAKLAIAFNTMIKIKPPVKNLDKGSIKYNLSKFLYASEHNNTCQAMRYGIEISKQSPWFKKHVLNELEARWKINKQLQLWKNKLEASTYEDVINSEEIKTEGDK